MSFPIANSMDHHIIQKYYQMLVDSDESFYRGFLDKDMDFHIIDIFDNFFEDENNLETMEFTKSEIALYKYNVKRLCIDLFGTHDFWQSILRINDMTHEGEFDLKGPIKVPKATEFINYLHYIYDMKKYDFKEGNTYTREI